MISNTLPPNTITRKGEHPSIVALMKDAVTGEKPVDVIRRKCREIIDRARTFGWSGPPFDPELLASLNGIVVEETESPLDGEGSVFVRDGQVVIQFLKGILRERQRFTICHELAHTCFGDAFEFVRRRLKVDEKAHQRFENLCDVGAGELLMPRLEFSARMGDRCPSVQLVTELSREFVASPDATIKRILDLTPYPCAAAFLTDAAFDTYREWRDRSRILWMWKSDGFRAYFPRGTLLPAYSICNSLLRDDSELIQFQREIWYLNNRPRSLYVQPLKLPEVEGLHHYPKILCVIHTKKPKS